jgi:hypothetical protein
VRASDTFYDAAYRCPRFDDTLPSDGIIPVHPPSITCAGSVVGDYVYVAFGTAWDNYGQGMGDEMR